MHEHSPRLKIDMADAGQASEIECYLAQVDAALFYASPAFGALIAEHLSCDTGWFIARKDENICGILPYATREGKYGPVYNSFAYYGSNGGVIQAVPDEEAKAALIDSFYNLAKSKGAVSATIITNPLEKDSTFYEGEISYDLRDERIGQITHFPERGTADELIKIFDDPRPRNIRRAEKEGVTVTRRNDMDAFNFLYQTHFANMVAIGGLAKDESFFHSAIKHIPENSRAIYVAELGGVPVAALLLFYYGRTVEYFTPVIVEQFRGSQALALIIYRAMQDAMKDGYKNWNWGGTWPSQGGVYDFKKRWGTSEARYFYYVKIFNPDVYNVRKDEIIKEYKGFFVIPFSALLREKVEPKA